MHNEKHHHITQENLNEIGITPQEIEEAGGLEAVRHIMWFFQKTDNYTDADIENAIIQAIEKKQHEDILKKAFDDFENEPETTDNIEQKNIKLSKNIPNTGIMLLSNPVLNLENATVKQIYEQVWGHKPHPALKLLLEAHFLEIQDIIPNDDTDKKAILKTIALLRAYIAGSNLPNDAEDEHLIVYARNMYKEFLREKEDYNNCPMVFLLDDYIHELSEKHRMIAQSLPLSGILRIFADNCFYDPKTHSIDEPLPEEINIKNLCDMIETLARTFKIWQ